MGGGGAGLGGEHCAGSRGQEESGTNSEFSHVGLASPTSPPGRDSIPAPGGKRGAPQGTPFPFFQIPPPAPSLSSVRSGSRAPLYISLGSPFLRPCLCLSRGRTRSPGSLPRPHQGEEGAGAARGRGLAGRGAAGLLGGGPGLGTDAPLDRRGRCPSASRAEAAARAEGAAGAGRAGLHGASGVRLSSAGSGGWRPDLAAAFPRHGGRAVHAPGRLTAPVHLR